MVKNVQTLLGTSHYAYVLMIYVKLYGTMVNDTTMTGFHYLFA